MAVLNNKRTGGCMKRTFFIVFPAVFLLAACQTLPTSSEYLARGDGYFKDGNAVAALKAYNKAVQINPDNLTAYASRGAVYFFNGDYKLAQEDFLKVLEANPYQVDAYTALGSALAAQGQFKDALDILNLALVMSPSKPEIFFSRGGVNYMLGEFEQAVFDYDYVLKLRPAADVYNARGAALLKLGKTKEAEADFEMAKSGQVPEKLNIYTMID